jgi:hypothetical protein
MSSDRERRGRTDRPGRQPHGRFPEGREPAKKGDPPIEKPMGERSRHGGSGGDPGDPPPVPSPS